MLAGIQGGDPGASTVLHRLPPGALPVIGNALDDATFVTAIPPSATFVHLVGTPHPNPAKAAEFRRVDLASTQANVAAARRGRAIGSHHASGNDRGSGASD